MQTPGFNPRSKGVCVSQWGRERERELVCDQEDGRQHKPQPSQLKPPSLFSPIRQTVDRPQGLDGERGGEDNIWKLIQFQPLCAASQSANTTTGWFKDKEISIYILDYTLWRICRMEPYGSVLTHLSSGHSLWTFKSNIWSRFCSLLTRHPLNFPVYHLMNFPHLQMVGKWSFFIFSTERLLCSFHTQVKERGKRKNYFFFSKQIFFTYLGSVLLLLKIIV